MHGSSEAKARSDIGGYSFHYNLASNNKKILLKLHELKLFVVEITRFPLRTTLYSWRN